MSTRRQARSRAPAPSRASGEIPAALLVGRCLEVWADPADRFAHWSAGVRFATARAAWLQSVGRGDVEPFTVISDHAPWSASQTPDRLDSSGWRVEDIPGLRAEADGLLELAGNTRPPNANPRRLTNEPTSR